MSSLAIHGHSVPRLNTISGNDPCFIPTGILLPQHRANLYDSGLSDRTIAELGVTTARSNDAWLLPIWDIGGTEIRGHRLRYDDEAVRENRYPHTRSRNRNVTPKSRHSPGLSNCFFYPHLSNVHWIEVASNPNIPILITEGEKKAALLTQEEFYCIGLPGVDGWLCRKTKDEWRPNESKTTPIPDFNGVKFSGRKVYIVFDGDKYGNQCVLNSERRLQAHLISLGADCRLINLPSNIKGVDDFFVSKGKSGKRDFKELILAA